MRGFTILDFGLAPYPCAWGLLAKWGEARILDLRVRSVVSILDLFRPRGAGHETQIPLIQNPKSKIFSQNAQAIF